MVHAVLKNVRDPKTDPLDKLFRKHLFQLEIDIDDIELHEIRTWLTAFLESAIAPPHWNGEHEFPFRMQIGDHLISGKVDYLWEEPDGFVLCDFKTDQKPDRKKHQSQLNIYALALSKHLLKPVKETRILFLRSQTAVVEPITPARLAVIEEELNELIRNRQ